MPKDACYRKVKSRYRVFPSAYASGAIAKCRKVGAANWGNSKTVKKESKWMKELSEKKQELLEMKSSIDVIFPRYEHPPDKDELPEVLRIIEEQKIPKEEIEDLDKDNHQLLLNIVGEKKSDWEEVIEDIDIHTMKLKMKYGRKRPNLLEMLFYIQCSSEFSAN